MAKFTPIRISQNDRKEYARLVRNSKAKINRTQKNYGIDLSSNVELPELGEFKTRDQFNEWKERSGSFTNRHNLTYQFVKNKYDIVASKKQINKIKRSVKQAQRVADAEIAKHMDKPVFHNEEKIGTVKDQTLHMSVPDVTGIHRPKDFDFDKVNTKRRLKSVEKSMEERSDPKHYDKKQVLMKHNFIDMLQKTFNSHADGLVKMLEKLPSDDFYEIYLANPSRFDFNLYYLPEGISIEDSGFLDDLVKMEGTVEKYTNGETDKDFKGF